VVGALAADQSDDPTRFVALTSNVELTPFRRPVMVQLVLPVVAQVCPPGNAWTEYPVTGVPPSDVGAVQRTVACPSPAVATTLVGTPGTAKVTTTLEADEGTLVPALLVAVTVKV